MKELVLIFRCLLLQVQVGKSESMDSAMRRLGKKMADAQIVPEVKRRKTYKSRRDRVLERKKSAVRKNRKHAGLKV